MINRVVLVGRLTRDPDLRYTASGIPVANFNVAVNRPFKNQQGEQEADFVNCVIWRKQAENLANYMKKGSLIGVEGRVQTSSYDDPSGKRVYVTEILAESVQFLEPRSASQQRAQSGGYYQNESYQQPEHQQDNYGGQQSMERESFANEGQQVNISDDDLPF